MSALDIPGMRDESWRQLLADVLIEREAAVQTCADTPLEFGAPIAWSTTLKERTNAFSPVHRVGFPQHGTPYTACVERIAGPYRWLPLSPAMIRTMDRCRACEAEIARVARERAA
jgi:hypothetical protein